jgi:hypothetical protein
MAKRQVLHNSKLKVGEYYFVKRWDKDRDSTWGRVKQLITIGKVLTITKGKSRWYPHSVYWKVSFQELTKNGLLHTLNGENVYPQFYPFTFKRALELLPKFKPKDKAQRAFLREALKRVASELTS